MTLNFTKVERLRGAEFDAVFQKGRRFKSDLFLFIYLHTNTVPNKLGLITAKKKLNTAVKRNLARRIIKEHFRLNKNQLNYYHIVAIAHKPQTETTREDYHRCANDFFSYLIKRSNRSAKA